MKENKNRRSFIKNIALGGIGVSALPSALMAQDIDEKLAGDDEQKEQSLLKRNYNAPYTGEHLKRLAFPVGGIGAGMFCLEGTGAISHMSVRNKPEVFNEPVMFAAVAIKGNKTTAKVLEGPVPDWKMFGKPGTGNGAAGTTYGLPRFANASFITSFPFGTVHLKDEEMPFDVSIKGWNPFIPGDADNASLPVGGLEYKFINTGKTAIDLIFSYHSKNFIVQGDDAKGKINKTDNGFVLRQDGVDDKPYLKADFAIYTTEADTVVDYCWFRGGWWDPLTMTWNTIKEGKVKATEPVAEDAPGASLFVPFTLKPGEQKTIKLLMAWYVPETNMHIGTPGKKDCDPSSGCCSSPADLGIKGTSDAYTNYKPWYSSRFKNINEVIAYWKDNYDDLLKKTSLFNKALYKSTLPAEVMEAVTANLTILKSPTVMRQYDGRLWNFEGCGDNEGCCHGSCTHVWNYAQAIAHLFPSLERSLRHTEFCENQNAEGHQTFRANTPITPAKHDFHAAADGQLGGIMKIYREWRISGDNEWLATMYPMVKTSIDYCIRTWDPRNHGLVEEPHHNTYDIEFWGPDGMCTSFYLGALKAIVEMGKHLNKDISSYQSLYEKGKRSIEADLYNGEYFFQKIQYEGLNAKNPAEAKSFGGEYSQEAKDLLQKEGPKYQYGAGCLSDGILGIWIGAMCGLHDIVDAKKVTSHLQSVHRYNLKKDLSDHANPQRPAYALGKEGGLLLCTWPKGGKLSLPFVYSDEVWTGIEYQVASHLMLMGRVEEGLEIVKYCRDRYDGRSRNPFNEYECGHWYGRALSSYGLIQGLTGVRYDAVEETLYIDSKMGDFTSFLSAEKGFGNVSLKNGKPSLTVAHGSINVKKVIVSGKEMALANASSGKDNQS